VSRLPPRARITSDVGTSELKYITVSDAYDREVFLSFCQVDPQNRLSRNFQLTNSDFGVLSLLFEHLPYLSGACCRSPAKVPSPSSQPNLFRGVIGDHSFFNLIHSNTPPPLTHFEVNHRCQFIYSDFFILFEVLVDTSQ
jgi:hypothetical protein